jgi:hypothetical protein
MRMNLITLTVLTGALALVGCGGKNTDNDVDALDQDIGGVPVSKGKNADPALTAALEDQIMVDPSLNNQANRHSVKPADEPFQAPIPPDQGHATPQQGTPVTLGALAEQQAKKGNSSFNGCQLDVDYSMAWANRLPADLPLYPRSRVDEAAGSDNSGCHLRAISFTSAESVETLVDFYLTQSRRAGYAAQRTQNGTESKVSGARARDGAAYYVLLNTVSGGGTTADLVANNGK